VASKNDCQDLEQSGAPFKLVLLERGFSFLCQSRIENRTYLNRLWSFVITSVARDLLLDRGGMLLLVTKKQIPPPAEAAVHGDNSECRQL
jgi:hypothetical protein